MRRMNISIPDDLRDRMDQHPDVNWSSLAQSTFELEIRSKAQGTGDMEQVIERLKASREQADLKCKPQWIAYGVAYASNKAEYDELRRLSHIEPEYILDNSGGYNLLKELASARDGVPADEAETIGFFEEAMGGIEELPVMSRAKLLWFLEGTMIIWNRVKDIV